MIEQWIKIVDNKIFNMFPNGNLSGLQPVKFVYNESVTVIPDNQVAFTLNPLVAGTSQPVDTQTSSEAKAGALARSIIGYLDLRKMAESDVYFNFKFPLLVNQLLTSLTKDIGSLNGRTVTLKRPSSGHCVLRDSDGFAGVEIRAYAGPREIENGTQ